MCVEELVRPDLLTAVLGDVSVQVATEVITYPSCVMTLMKAMLERSQVRPDQAVQLADEML